MPTFHQLAEGPCIAGCHAIAWQISMTAYEASKGLLQNQGSPARSLSRARLQRWGLGASIFCTLLHNGEHRKLLELPGNTANLQDKMSLSVQRLVKTGRSGSESQTQPRHRTQVIAHSFVFAVLPAIIQSPRLFATA